MAQQSSSLSLEKVILKVINRYFDVSLIMGIMLTGSRVTNFFVVFKVLKRNSQNEQKLYLFL